VAPRAADKPGVSVVHFMFPRVPLLYAAVCHSGRHMNRYRLDARRPAGERVHVPAPAPAPHLEAYNLSHKQM